MPELESLGSLDHEKSPSRITRLKAIIEVVKYLESELGYATEEKERVERLKTARNLVGMPLYD